MRDSLWYDYNTDPNISKAPNVICQIYKINAPAGTTIYTRFSPKPNYNAEASIYLTLGKVNSVSCTERPYSHAISATTSGMGGVMAEALNKTYTFIAEKKPLYLAVHYINGTVSGGCPYKGDKWKNGECYQDDEDNVYVEFASDPEFKSSHTKFDVKKEK